MAFGAYHFFDLEVAFPMEKFENGPTQVNTRKRKNLLESKMVDIPYEELFKMYVTDCRLRGIAEVTIKGYDFAHTYFKRHVGDNLKCSDITQDLINGYILHLKDRLKPESVNSYQFKISPVIRYGMSKGYIKDSIEFTHLKEQEHIKDIYTEAELKKILKRPENPTFAEYRNWVLCNFLLATGIRAKELRELLIRDVNLPEGYISLSHTKNRKPRMIPIPSTLHAIMIEYLQIRGGSEVETLFTNVFGEPLCRATLQYCIIKHCKRVGVKKHSLHLFRHTFITMSVRKGMSPVLLRRITGHSNYKVLDKYYQHNVTDLVNVVDTFNPLEDFKPRSKKISM